jgi:Skp family chaperone for outer membrane proteins
MAVGFASPATAPSPSRGEEASGEQQVKDLEKQVQDLTSKLNELKKENLKAAPALPPQPQTKVAVLNLSYVIKNYKKWETFQHEYKSKLDAFDEKLKPQKVQLDELDKNRTKPGIDPDTKADIEKKMQDLERSLQDETEEYKKTLAEFEAKSFATMYNDVNMTAERYAKAHDIELVMHFNDGTTEDEINSPNNITRKIGQGALFPIYVTPGMDISKDMLALLNKEKDQNFALRLMIHGRLATA